MGSWDRVCSLVSILFVRMESKSTTNAEPFAPSYASYVRPGFVDFISTKKIKKMLITSNKYAVLLLPNRKRKKQLRRERPN